MRRKTENEKSKNIERTLLAGVISIVLCCGALAGTAYAWMMDSVSADVATIQAGTLEVDLVDALENGKSFILKDGEVESTVPLVFTTAVDGTTHWDIGKTYQLPTMYVVNKGTTDLKYTISIEGITDKKLDEITTVNLTELIDFSIQINDEVVNAGKLQMSDNPDTTELDESRHTVVISGKLKDNVNLDSYQGMEFTGITIKIDAEQTE